MKTNSTCGYSPKIQGWQSAPREAIVLCLALLVGSTAALAGTIQKANTGTALNAGASWVLGTAPASTDVAQWDTTVTTAATCTNTLGGNLSWQGIKIIDPVATVDIGGANTLTNGSAGINLADASASQDLNLHPNAVALSADQTWNVKSGRTLIVSSSMSGTLALTKTGAGTLVLGHSKNTFTNTSASAVCFTLAEGTVAISGTGKTLGAGAVTFAGGTVRSASTTAASATGNPFYLAGDVTFGDSVNTGNLTFNANSSGGNWVIQNATRTITVDTITATLAGGNSLGESGGTCGLTLGASSSGKLVIAGTINYNGLTTVNGGTLEVQTKTLTGGGFTLNTGTLAVGNKSAFGTGTVTLNGGTVRANGATAMDMTGNATASYSVTLAADMVLGGASPNDGALNFGVSAGTWAAWTISGATRKITCNNTNMISAPILDAGSGYGLTKAGTGLLIINNSHSGSLGTAYSGTTTIESGAIALTKHAWIGNNLGPLAFAGGTLMIAGSRDSTGGLSNSPVNLTSDGLVAADGGLATLTTTRYVAFFGSMTANPGKKLTVRNVEGAAASVFDVRLNAAASYDFPIVVGQAGDTGNAQVSFFNTAAQGDQTFTANAVISGPGAVRRSASVSGTGGKTTLNAASTYEGNTLLNDGEIAFGCDSTGPANAPTAGPIGKGVLTVGGAKVSAAGGARVVGNSITFSSSPLYIEGANDLELAGDIALGSSVTRTIQVDNSGASKLSGVLSGSVAGLTKTGSGTLTLANANTYSGATRVLGGTFKLSSSGSINNTTSIRIADGATYDVSSVAGYAVLGSPAQILGGWSSNGTANVNGSVTLASGAAMQFEADGTGGTVGKLLVTGGLTLNGNSITVNVNTAPLWPGTYRLIDYTGSKSGTFNSTVTITGLGLIAPGSVALNESVGGQVDLVVTVIPPQITSAAQYGTNLVLSGSGGSPNGTCNVLTSTNVAAAMADWTTNVTSAFDGSGNFIITNTIDSAESQRFFRIKYP